MCAGNTFHYNICRIKRWEVSLFWEISCCERREGMVKYGFGVDIGGTTCKLGLFSLEGELLEKWEIPTDTADGGVGILSDVADAVEQKLKKRQIPRDEVLGIGLDAPGAIGEDGVVSQAVNLGWRQYPARDVLSQRMNMKVRICNDANAAALGEQWKGGGAGCLDMVMVTLGTGVGGAVIAGGKVIGGAHGIAGEIGHMIVYAGETERCACGRYGCLEQYASASGLVRVTRCLLEKKNRRTILSDTPELSAKQIIDAAKRGDELALDTLEILGKTLGRALAATAVVTDPERFVIGGGVSKAGEILLEITKKYYVQEVLTEGRETEFALAMLGNDAGMYGSMRLLLD